MAFAALVIIGLVVLFLPGLALLLAGLLGRKRRKGRLIAGIVLCAPLPVFFLMALVGSLIETIGGRL